MKWNKFNKKIKEKELNYIVVFTELNRFWITQFECSYGFLLFSKEQNKSTLFLDPRYIIEGKEKIKNIDIKPLNNFSKIFQKLEGNIGIENDLKIETYKLLKNLNKNLNFKIINFDELRKIKNNYEIEKISKISKITNQVWNQILNLKLNKYTEKEIDIKIRELFLKNGISNISFNPIVSTNLNSIFIHTKPTNEKIKSHLLCDFGGKLNGYCSDYTRVKILENNKELKKYYDFVINVSNEVFKLIKPGVAISKLVKKANEMYKNNNYEVLHALGHGIGLKVHEYPLLHENNNELLKEGMVFTIEPGVYVKNIGGVRYENIVVVTKNGFEILTK